MDRCEMHGAVACPYCEQKQRERDILHQLYEAVLREYVRQIARDPTEAPHG